MRCSLFLESVTATGLMHGFLSLGPSPAAFWGPSCLAACEPEARANLNAHQRTSARIRVHAQVGHFDLLGHHFIAVRRLKTNPVSLSGQQDKAVVLKPPLRC